MMQVRSKTGSSTHWCSHLHGSWFSKLSRLLWPAAGVATAETVKFEGELKAKTGVVVREAADSGCMSGNNANYALCNLQQVTQPHVALYYVQLTTYSHDTECQHKTKMLITAKMKRIWQLILASCVG